MLHRPDIDGVRALAVIAVLVFHAFPSVLPGGFVGVDVFFVISGFLITSLIVEDQAAGRLSLLGFYRRRLHRLFPALFVVTAAILLLGYLVMFEDEFCHLGRHVLSSSCFAENFQLLTETSYWDPVNSQKPTLHFWSLAIEEQFYAVFPLLLIALHRLGWRLWPVLTLAIAASFSCQVFVLREHPANAFYLPHLRVWELLLGALIAATNRHLAIQRSAISRNAVSCIGLALVVTSCVCLNALHPYPGIRALLPVLGTACLILAGPHALPNHALLANRAMVSIGLISYPLYLWHWPLLSFLAITTLETPGPWAKAACLLSSLVLAFLTYRVIEAPVRRHLTALTTGLLLTGVALIACLGYLAANGSFPPCLGGEKYAPIRCAIDDWEYPSRLSLRSEGATWLSGGNGMKTLYWGDSNMEQFAPRIVAVLSSGKAGDRGAVFLTRPATPPFPFVNCPSVSFGGLEFTHEFLSHAARPDIDTVVIAAMWDCYLNNPTLLYHAEGQAKPIPLDQPGVMTEVSDTMAGTFLAITNAGKRLFLVLQTPYGHHLDPHSLIRPLFRRATSETDYSERPEISARFLAARAFLHGIAARCGAQLIDPLPLLSEGGRGRVTDAEFGPIYKDSGHIRASFARARLDFLDATILPVGAR